MFKKITWYLQAPAMSSALGIPVRKRTVLVLIPSYPRESETERNKQRNKKRSGILWRQKWMKVSWRVATSGQEKFFFRDWHLSYLNDEKEPKDNYWKNIWAEGTVSTKAVRSNSVRSREEASVAETRGGKGDGSYTKSGTGKGKAAMEG